MDVEPIYCAEQIVVPPDLADVLKAYAKEVIRRQPQDLLEFSAIYFANLANFAQGISDLIPPTKEQLQVVYTSLPSGKTVEAKELVELCKQAGIAKSTLAKVFDLGNFDMSSTLQPKQILVMLLTMAFDSLPAVVGGLFDVFGEGGTLETDEFLTLLGYMASLDKDLSPDLMDALTKSLESTSFLTFAALRGNPVVKDILLVV